MQNVGRNDPCPCGNGKKYKHCYLSKDKDCSLYQDEDTKNLLSEHAKKLASILEVLPTFTAELHQLFYKTDQDEEIVPSRMQLIGSFTTIDVLANYWSEYIGISGKPSERFHEYLKRFGLVEANKTYANRKYLSNLTTEELYEFRNGLVHFYGLYGNKYGILPNPSKTASQEQLDTAYKNFKVLGRSQRIEMTFIQPLELKDLIIESAALMLEHFKEREFNPSVDTRVPHAKGINRIYQKIQKEGASVINQNILDKLDRKIAGRNTINF